MMLSKYDAVFFDAGGTLLHPFPSVGEIYQRVGVRYGSEADAATLEDLFRQVWHQQDGLTELASHSDEKKEKDWWRGMVHEVFAQAGGVRDFDIFFNELYDLFAQPETWRLYPETHEILAELKKTKRCVGVVSNWDSRLFGLCEQMGIGRHVDFILASAVFGAAKPNPKIFEEALRRSGVPAGRAVHIGDSMTDDIGGALSLGLDGILIDRHNRKEKLRGALRPTHIIRDLRELLG